MSYDEPTVPLIGRIHHVISSKKDVAADSDQPTGSKRPRPWESSDASDPISGFVFTRDESSQSLLSSFNTFHLVIPNSLMRLACRAAANGLIVQLLRYTLIRYCDGRGQVIFDGSSLDVDRDSGENCNRAYLVVAEVHSRGLVLLEEKQEGESKQSKFEGSVLTLDMLATKEQSLSKKEKKSAKNPMNITAVIDAISPIFTHDTERPFALMELYQPGNTTYSAVAVLRGEEALCMHSAIQPGQSVVLAGVVNRSWKVPDGFRQLAERSSCDDSSRFYTRLYHRTPDRVILVEDPNCIQFDDEYHSHEGLPSTIESLTSVRGVIESIHYYQYKDTRNSKTEHIVHFVTVRQFNKQFDYDSDGNEPESCTKQAVINLLRYSFSPHAILGLQVGAIIRAINIHRIRSPSSKECYVACLRSTVSIEQCASESSNNLWFISNSPSSHLVPNHRIDKMCSDLSGLVPSTRYNEEDVLRMKVQQLKIMDPKVLAQNLRILLNHHYGKVHSSSISSSSHQQALRDPYSEFFDHAHSDGSLDNNCGSYTLDPNRLFRQEEPSSPRMLNVVRLEVLRDRCTQDFIQRVAKICNEAGSRVCLGSTSSYHYYSSRVYVWGQVSFAENKPMPTAWAGTIHHDACKIPFSIAQDGTFDRLHDHSGGWLQVKSVLLSCLCLGRVQVDEENESKDDQQVASAFVVQHKFIPSSACRSDETLGHNFVFLVNGFIFIGSIQFIAIPVSSGAVNNKADRNFGHVNDLLIKPKDVTISIQDCLQHTRNSNIASISITGRLIRHRFRFCKAKRAKDYEGWTIILSHIDRSRDNALNTSSFLQTIEVKVAITAGSPSDYLWTALKTTLRDLLLSSAIGSTENSKHIDPLHKVSSEQLTMGLAFLNASGNSSTQLALSGGWETSNKRLLSETASTSSLQSISIYIKIPLASRGFSSMGYQRFKCNLQYIEAFAVMETFHSSEPSCPAHVLDFKIDTRKFLTGMLSQRLVFARMHATTNMMKDAGAKTNLHAALNIMNDVVPSVSLADLHHDVCKVLSEKQHAHLRPSLLQRIRRVKILGITFCRARVECTQCFEFLKLSSSDKEALVCPSGCRSTHAAMKWECSALIDDGTGQAKLYAEREAALLLLGTSLDIDSIEQGAWISQNGVFFQPALPPSNYLQRCMKEAHVEAKKHNAQLIKEDRECYLKGKPATAYDFINTLAKAEYLLQHHCRQWYQKQHSRRLDLFCRCKPLSTEATSVNRTEIQVAKAIDGSGLDFGTVQTCTLPPLKLVLEDMCLAAENGQDNRMIAWGLFANLSDP